jgi:hypothetical protein
VDAFFEGMEVKVRISIFSAQLPHGVLRLSRAPQTTTSSVTVDIEGGKEKIRFRRAILHSQWHLLNIGW